VIGANKNVRSPPHSGNQYEDDYILLPSEHAQQLQSKLHQLRRILKFGVSLGIVSKQRNATVAHAKGEHTVSAQMDIVVIAAGKVQLV